MNKKYNTIIESSNSLLKNNFPKIIEFQTNTLCNGNCIVCPYKELSQKQKPIKMNNECLEKILKEIIYNKDKIERVIPYLNNEPSLDNRIMGILKTLKKEDIFVELSTNISNFSEIQLQEIVQERLIDDLRISFFGDTKELYNYMMPNLNYEKNIEKINYLNIINKNSENPISIKIILILLPELNIKEIITGIKKLFKDIDIHCFGYLDRAGKVSNFKNVLVNDEKFYQIKGCSLNRPFERACINANGDMILCSQDWESYITFGNIKNNSIEEIWNNKNSIIIKNMILGKCESPNNIICNKCKLAIIEKNSNLQLNFKGDKYISKNDEKKIKDF